MTRSLLALLVLCCVTATGWGSDRKAAAAESPWPEPDAAKVAAVTDELKQQLPGFAFARLGPWIVATDQPEAQAKALVADLIGTYAAQIQRQLFAKPRTEPVKVMLFKDKDSYEAWNVKLFGEKPSTIFGYYSRARNALVMNIGTGGGTLLHEMTHAMAEADFPEIPAWLNEGLGSLYEASSLGRDGRMRGIANWRLPGLIEALDAGKAPAYADLFAMSDSAFYDDDAKGANYASSRYLMQWLQEQGQLEAFYGKVRDGATGADALTSVIGHGATVQTVQERVAAWARALARKP
jgi:hypothetical protein